MVCALCEKRSGNFFLPNDDAQCFIELLESLKEHHFELQNKCQRLSLENDSLRNQVEELQSEKRHRKKYLGSQKSQTESVHETQPLFPEDDDKPDDLWISPVNLAKENTPKRSPLSVVKDNLSGDESIFVGKLPKRSKTATKASSSKWFDESLSPVKEFPKPRRSSKKKPKLVQTTLPFSRTDQVDKDATYCEELTPDSHILKKYLKDTPPRPKARLRLDNTEIHPEDTLFVDDPKPLRSFHTPDGFWDLDFPPTAKTQKASPSDRLQKRPRKS